MDIFKKKTRKGLVIRYVFDDEDEYNNLIDAITSICDKMPEDDKKDIEELIKLFKDYYNPQSEYAEGKPSVTVFEDHLLTLAVLVWNVIPIYTMVLKQQLNATKKYVNAVENYTNEVKEHTETLKKLRDAKQTIIDADHTINDYASKLEKCIDMIDKYAEVVNKYKNILSELNKIEDGNT